MRHLRYALGTAAGLLIISPLASLYLVRCAADHVIWFIDFLIKGRRWADWLMEKGEAAEDWGSRQ